MTEEDWVTTADPFAMLDSLRGWSTDRKMRLFACACCLQVYQSLVFGPGYDAVLVAERHADGLCTDDDLKAANASARGYVFEVYGDDGYWGDLGCVVTETDPWQAMHHVTRMSRFLMPHNIGEVRMAFRSLIHDIFGNPYRTLHLDPRWRTEDVLGLARGIYEDRAFDRLPLLGDALMDAGCDNEDVLAHCRSDGPHAKGCWVVDGVLGKE
jgi:hypothetical protein